MKAIWKILPDGAFVCGDLDSRVTNYSYPSSTNATSAKKAARKGLENVAAIAVDILEGQLSGYRGDPAVCQAYDDYHWQKLA